MHRLLCALALICFAVRGFCDTPSSGYEVIQDKPISAGAIRDVLVRIPEPISEDEVRRIATDVKASSRKKYPKTSIVFLLPGMEPGNRAWARAVFKPDLQVTIIGTPAEQKKKIDAAPALKGTIIGEWFYDLPGLSHRITFLRRGDKLFMVKSFPDGSAGEEEILSLGDRKFSRKDGNRGGWMEVNGKGDLDFYDQQGKADTAVRAKSSPAPEILDGLSSSEEPPARGQSSSPRRELSKPGRPR